MSSTWRQRWIEASPAAERVLAHLDRELTKHPQPNRGEDDFRRLVGVLGATDAEAWLAKDPLRVSLYLQLGAVSRAGIDVVLKRPGAFRTVVEGRQYAEVWGRSGMSSHVGALLSEFGNDPEGFMETLVRFKEHQYLRLILGDVTGRMRFESLIAELSDLVDVIAEAALQQARQLLAPKWGEPALPFTVLGMGKLGGRELNYSSDIDLIFIYRNEETEEWDAHDYAQRLGTHLIRILDEPTAAGFLFRVDMRLRPEGDRGELALSLRETVDYYYSVGRPWERQAMIKARPIAGDIDLGKRLLADLRPWIFPKDAHWDELDDTRAMRRRIEERRSETNLKTGAGGIRDIEFMVQFFQLSHGGRLPELRGRATIPMLRTLGDVGLLPADEVVELDSHYRFLRIVEHRLQMWEDRQLHDVPVDPIGRLELAGRCGYLGADALERFVARIATVRSRVRELVECHYLRDSSDQDAILALLVQDEIDDELIATVLSGWNFSDQRQAAQNLRRMAREPFFLLSRSRTERSLAALVPILLPLISASPDPDQTLNNFARISDALGGRSTFYDLLSQQVGARRLMCDLAGWANYLVNLLGEVPGLADEVADTISQPLRSAVTLIDQANALVVDLDDLVPPLRFFQARETMTAAIRDLNGVDPATVNYHLSNVAVAIVAAVLDRCVAKRVAEWGMPLRDGVPTRFCILGLGKLGSRALSYASDMDVIFVCDSGGMCSDGEHDGEMFWTRVTQECMRVLDDGRLYEIDPRLRPWGDQGSLVTTFETLQGYWAESRDLWERLAMIRMSPIAGDPRLAEACMASVRNQVMSTPLPTDAMAQVRDMRQRLEESVVGRDHVKRGWGGYVDHEFIAQTYCMGVDPELIPVGSSIAEILNILGNCGRIPAAAATALIKSLLWLRFVESRQRLSAGKAVSSIPIDLKERYALARRCQKDDVASFDLEMHDARQVARYWFNELIH